MLAFVAVFLIKENNFADAISVLGESGYIVEENKGVLTE